MNCYESTHTTSATAVAICSGCGAALCADHVNECPREIIHTNAVGPASISKPDGRTLCCTTCKTAGTTSSHLLR